MHSLHIQEAVYQLLHAAPGFDENKPLEHARTYEQLKTTLKEVQYYSIGYHKKKSSSKPKKKVKLSYFNVGLS